MLSSSLAIEVKNLSKTFQVYSTPLDRLKQMLWGVRRRYFKSYTALRSIDLQISRGEVVGIIGQNGAGKSTLLQLISGTLQPTYGEIAIEGKISALLELGAGFNPEFTGRENIQLSAALMGLSKSEILTLEDEIIEFSGIFNFIDQPLKTYSSGMFVRLAFSVLTSVKPDILIIDEALSVGDGEFAKKSFDRIMAMREQGKTILFCSHSLYQVEQICNRVIWIAGGEVRAQGSPVNVIREYQGYLDTLNQTDSTFEGDESKIYQADEAHFISVKVTKSGGLASDLIFESELDDLFINVTFKILDAIVTPGVAIVINNENGLLVTSVGSWIDGVQPEQIGPSLYNLTLRFPRLALLRGLYKISAILLCERGVFVYDEINEVAFIRVVQRGGEYGIVSLPRVWNEGLVAESTTEQFATGPENDLEIRFATEEDETQLLSLFKKCFQYPISKSLWRWKYKSSIHMCAVAQKGPHLVGFFGVMPRDTSIFGAESRTAQICDVMLDPSLDVGLAKAKVFKRMKDQVTHRYVGINHAFPFAFGFPTERAQGLGERLGSYTRAGGLVRLEWHPQKISRRRLGFRSFDRSDFAYLKSIWIKTRCDFDGLVVNDKGPSWMFHRYFDRPGSEYGRLLFYTRYTGTPVGVAITRDTGDGSLELMDLIGPKAYLKLVLYHFMHLKAHQGVNMVFAIVSESVVEVLKDTGCSTKNLTSGISGDEIKENSNPLAIQGKWWLWGGDTDSR